MSPDPQESTIDESDSSWARVRVRRVYHHIKRLKEGRIRGNILIIKLSYNCQVCWQEVIFANKGRNFGLHQTRVKLVSGSESKISEGSEWTLLKLELELSADLDSANADEQCLWVRAKSTCRLAPSAHILRPRSTSFVQLRNSLNLEDRLPSEKRGQNIAWFIGWNFIFLKFKIIVSLHSPGS